MAAAAQSQQNIAQVNAQLRAALLATAPRMRKNLGVFSQTSVGGTTRIRLFNVGLLTKIQLLVTVQVTIGTLAGTASPKGPWNLIQSIQLNDFNGTSRINCTGFQLFQLNSARYREPFGYNNSAESAIITNPNQPLATGSQNITFLIDVPVAYQPESDLRGAILMQSGVGDMFLNINWNPTLYTNGNDDAVYNGAATTTVALGANGYQVQAWQEYLLPQAIGGKLPLPPLDLMTVYEIAGNIVTTDNIAAGTEKLINYPNVRTVIGAYVDYTKAGTTLAGVGDTSEFRLIANGNNILRDETETSQYFNQRIWYHGDLVKGSFLNMHRQKPIETALFGNVQWGVTPVNAGAGSYMNYMFESFYTQGTTLPGFNQG
jgi:hypothetical protein